MGRMKVLQVGAVVRRRGVGGAVWAWVSVAERRRRGRRVESIAGKRSVGGGGGGRWGRKTRRMGRESLRWMLNRVGGFVDIARAWSVHTNASAAFVTERFPPLQMVLESSQRPQNSCAVLFSHFSYSIS